MDLILFGIQGSGKGTQGKFLANHFNFEIFETGNELRKLSREENKLGKKVKSTIEAGSLVKNEIVMEIVEHFMNHLTEGKNVLFDGIPRKKDQQKSLEALMQKHGRAFTGVHFTLSESDAIARLTVRRMCEKCKTVYPASYAKDACEKCEGKLITRSDDNPESIRNRFRAFNEETLPVINDYKSRDLMIEVNGNQPIESVTQELFQKLEPVLK